MKMQRLICLALLLVASSSQLGDSYKILGVFPYPGKSHFYIFEAIMKGLADKGHDVTVISMNPQKSPYPNYRDVELTNDETGSTDLIKMDELPAGRLIQYGAPLMLHSFAMDNCNMHLPSKQLKTFLEENQQYDVAIIESFNTDCFYPIVYKLKVPFITISSSILMPWNYEHLGNPNNPAYMPQHFLHFTDQMTFWQRVENTLAIAYTKAIYKFLMTPFADDVVAKVFGQDVPRPADIVKNASLMFINTHVSISGSKPLVPGIIEIGGVHVKKPKPVPKNIEKWIGDSKDGVIYFSMGSMIKGHTFPEEKRQIFMRVFGRLPQRVLWKWENDTMPGKPDNVMTQKWMPQFDILCHPNVKAYISHGGLLGTTEAVHCGVPALVMPQYGDQHANAKALEASGGGVVLDFNNLSEENVYNALKTILEPSFNKQTKELSERFRDRPLPPLETAIYWVEYVARHKGARHLRTAAVDMPLYQYYLLDVIAFLGSILFAVVLINYCVLRAVIRKLCFSGGDKSKKKQKKN